MKTVRLLVAGDIRLYREGLAFHLARRPEVESVACACGRAELVSTLSAQPADVVLIDMVMPESVEAVGDIAVRWPDVHVVALAVPENEPAVLACAEAGVAGWVSREGSLEDLVDAVTSVARGEFIVSPRMAASLLRRVSSLAHKQQATNVASSLTAREIEISQLVDLGFSNKQIAARLGIEVATVKNHVHRILEKLHARRRGEIPALLRGDLHPGFSRL